MAPDQSTNNAFSAMGEAKKHHVGVIMPISGSEQYKATHWAQVLKLIVRAADAAGFTGSMVSENSGEDMIHASIFRNIYQNEVVVCDVSSLNANVMLEMGLRMATLKPLVLVFDGDSKYPFDITQFIHVRYSRALNYEDAESFVKALSEQIGLVAAAYSAGTYKAFLSHFQEVTVEPLEFNDTAKNLTDALNAMKHEVSTMRGEVRMALNVQGQQGPYGAYCSLPTAEEKLTLDEAWVKAHKSSSGFLSAMPDSLKNFLLSDVIKEVYAGASTEVRLVRREALIPYIDYYYHQQQKKKDGYNANQNFFPKWPPMG